MMLNTSSIESLPKRFLWMRDFPWSIDSFVEGRTRLEKLTSSENESFERLPPATQRAVIMHQAEIDNLFYYDDPLAFCTAYAPEKLSRVTLRNAMSVVALMRKERRPGLTRDTVPMVGLDWYTSALRRLFKLKDPHARTQMHTFLSFDYTAAECAPVCEMAYLADLKADPEYAPRWLSAMIGHQAGVDEDDDREVVPTVSNDGVLSEQESSDRDSPETEDLIRLLAMHPCPGHAWKIYYENVLMPNMAGRDLGAGTRYTFNQTLTLCTEQLAYGKDRDHPLIWQGWVSAFPTILTYARDQVPNDQCVSDLELVGWQILDVALGKSLEMSKALGLDLLEIFATLPSPGTDLDVTLPVFSTVGQG